MGDPGVGTRDLKKRATMPFSPIFEVETKKTELYFQVTSLDSVQEQAMLAQN